MMRRILPLAGADTPQMGATDTVPSGNIIELHSIELRSIELIVVCDEEIDENLLIGIFAPP